MDKSEVPGASRSVYKVVVVRLLWVVPIVGLYCHPHWNIIVFGLATWKTTKRTM